MSGSAAAGPEVGVWCMDRPDVALGWPVECQTDRVTPRLGEWGAKGAEKGRRVGEEMVWSQPVSRFSRRYAGEPQRLAR